MKFGHIMPWAQTFKPNIEKDWVRSYRDIKKRWTQDAKVKIELQHIDMDPSSKECNDYFTTYEDACKFVYTNIGDSLNISQSKKNINRWLDSIYDRINSFKSPINDLNKFLNYNYPMNNYKETIQSRKELKNHKNETLKLLNEVKESISHEEITYMMNIYSCYINREKYFIHCKRNPDHNKPILHYMEFNEKIKEMVNILDDYMLELEHMHNNFEKKIQQVNKKIKQFRHSKEKQTIKANIKDFEDEYEIDDSYISKIHAEHDLYKQSGMITNLIELNEMLIEEATINNNNEETIQLKKSRKEYIEMLKEIDKLHKKEKTREENRKKKIRKKKKEDEERLLIESAIKDVQQEKNRAISDEEEPINVQKKYTMAQIRECNKITGQIYSDELKGLLAIANKDFKQCTNLEAFNKQIISIKLTIQTIEQLIEEGVKSINELKQNKKCNFLYQKNESEYKSYILTYNIIKNINKIINLTDEIINVSEPELRMNHGKVNAITFLHIFGEFYKKLEMIRFYIDKINILKQNISEVPAIFTSFLKYFKNTFFPWFDENSGDFRDSDKFYNFVAKDELNRIYEDDDSESEEEVDYSQRNSYGKRKKQSKEKKLRAQAKRLKIRLTLKRKGKRVYKSNSVLQKQINNKLKKRNIK